MVGGCMARLAVMLMPVTRLCQRSKNPRTPEEKSSVAETFRRTSVLVRSGADTRGRGVTATEPPFPR